MQGRNVVLESKFGSPRIVNDGVTVAKEVELEDPVENIGAKLVRQVCFCTEMSQQTVLQGSICNADLVSCMHMASRHASCSCASKRLAALKAEVNSLVVVIHHCSP